MLAAFSSLKVETTRAKLFAASVTSGLSPPASIDTFGADTLASRSSSSASSQITLKNAITRCTKYHVGAPRRPCSRADKYAGETPISWAIALRAIPLDDRNSLTFCPNGVIQNACPAGERRSRTNKAPPPPNRGGASSKPDTKLGRDRSHTGTLRRRTPLPDAAS
jgi:hypothetical protein